MQIPKLTQRQQDVMQNGQYPFCENQIRGWKVRSWYREPEAYGALVKNGVDPRTGHSIGCVYKAVVYLD